MFLPQMKHSFSKSRLHQDRCPQSYGILLGKSYGSTPGPTVTGDAISTVEQDVRTLSPAADLLVPGTLSPGPVVKAVRPSVRATLRKPVPLGAAHKPADLRSPIACHGSSTDTAASH